VLPANFASMRSMSSELDDSMDQRKSIVSIGYIAGLMPITNHIKFFRNAFRISRGNIMMKQYNFTKEQLHNCIDT